MMKKIPVGIWWIGAAIVVILGVIIFSHSSPTTSSVSTTSTSTDTQTSVTSESGLPGIQITPAPWTVELSHLRERLRNNSCRVTDCADIYSRTIF